MDKINDIIDLNNMRKHKENKCIKFCACGAILKTEKEKDIEICFDCLEFIVESFHNGEIEKTNPLYDFLASVVNKDNVEKQD